MESKNVNQYGPTVLRLLLGLLFVIPGLMKLMNPGMIIGMLGELGFPAPAFFGWLLLLSEIVFGVAVLVGWKVRYTVWPLVFIMLVAIFTVTIPTMQGNPVTLLFHLAAVAGLVSLYLTGPGALGVKQN